MCSLENIIERAIGITLASQGNNSQQRQRRRRPRFQARNSRISSPEDIPVIPNLEICPRPATPAPRRSPTVVQEVQPTLLRPQARPILVPPITHQHSTSSEENQYLETQDIQVYCHLPESIYVANHLPTRKPRELTLFKEHCRLQYNAHRQPLVLSHPLERIREITVEPLNFTDFLWKSKTTVSHFGIFEEYQWLRRKERIHHPDHIIWQPAYQVFYAWDSEGWNVSRLVNERRRNRN